MAGKNGEIRCSNCGKLLLTGEIVEADISIKCKCGTVNGIQKKPKVVNVPFQDRMNLVKKTSGRSF